MKVIFMGTPDFAVPTLEALSKEHEVSLVITQTDKPKGRGKLMCPSPVKVKALELGIPVFQPENINTEDSIAKIREVEPDIIIVVAYGQILKSELLNLPKYKCINVHASLLPKYRGAAPLNWVVIDGEKKTGVTIMEMCEGLDCGDMMSKEELIIDEDMTAGDVHDTLMDIGSDLLMNTLCQIEGGDCKRVAQDHDESSYAPIMDKKLGQIDWNKSAVQVRNLVLGTQPWPSAYFTMDGKNVKVLEVEVCTETSDKPVGYVLDVSPYGIKVNTADGTVILKKVQFPCKKAVTIEDYLRGNEFESGIILS